jgi:carboxyl-terminal processing protease
VDLEVLPADGMPRAVKLVRRPVVAPSVDHEALTLTTPEGEDIPVGYLRITNFQETTLQEVKEAIAILRTPSPQADAMRALIIDLRGNPGGLFKPAVQVADLFLSEGVIVHSHSPFREYDRPYRADGMNPLRLPMVVLIDSDTASGGEVVAGALKGRPGTLLVGQTTFGKGSIQCIIPLDKIPLDKMPGGIRITVAKLCSPADQPYNGRGVTPDIATDLEGLAALAEAKRVLLGILRPPPMAPPMPPMMAQ